MCTVLRTLTYKSKLNFGKHALLTIQELFNLKETNYLRWIYYNCDKINFMDDIIEKLKIVKIEKPGKNPELCETIVNSVFKEAGYKIRSHVRKKMKLRAYANLKNFENSIFLRKGHMAFKNQGHF